MTIVLVTKKRIINALRKERLKPGHWLASKEMISASESDNDALNETLGKQTTIKDCMVCAVGAVFRSVCAKNSIISEVEKHIKNQDISAFFEHSVFGEENALRCAKNFVEDEQYMSALSSYFEWLDENTQHKPYRIKMKLVKFVEENFPKSIELDINGIQPAKDVKVIRE